MGSVPDRAQTIQGGNAKGGGEVSVRAPANRSFRKMEPELFGSLSCQTVELHGRFGTFEGAALHSSKNFQAAPGIERSQFTDSSIYASGLRCSEKPHIHDNFGQIGDNVGAGASGDEAGVESESAGGAGESCQGDYLVSRFLNGRGAALEIKPGMGSTAMDAKSVAGNAFARSLAGPGSSGRWFKHEDGAMREGEALGKGPRSGAANLLVRHE
jgi:hypothetical protein